MKFAVKAWNNGGKARSGVLQLGSCPHNIETPALLLTTRKGLPVYIPPDHLPSLPSPDSNLLHFSPLHFLEGISLKAISNIGGLHPLLGLHDHIMVAVPRDSIISIPDHDSTNRIGASFETPCGRMLIKPADYMEMISSMRPNLWATLADEVPAWVSEKRNKASVERTLKWLDECITSNSTDGAVLGSVVGGSRVEQRRSCAQEVARRNVEGFWIGGFGLGESMEERNPLLNAVMDSLPEQKPRLISGLGLPEVLQGVAAGVDLFDSTYIYDLTLGGFALTFPLESIEKQVTKYQPNSNSGCDGTKINLKATMYRKDTSPIVDNCKCYTCQNHTKAYINHLLNVHEMLAHILLEMHNTHHFLGFFRSIREAIHQGNFQKFRQKFIGNRHEHLFSAALSV
ncbi:queuine tRNA-ribosyltransferase accessory subunit 2-like isoform X2 [Solanum pennellii]|uniref:Queuine tRNA-ribosyltransferase accessory subunit 2 n=1 Tax=Solanum pennellii TaxID=28526 RepID=A0ABM1FP15_SOLPN|nr:queuine tRNA-ribosyltransferase accessory subunit 2-like isoform X2 [Solanum pennellii]